MDCEQAVVFLETILKPESLNDVQILVFRQAWENRVYQEIAESAGYDADYLRDVGSQLWRSLSQALGEKVTKSNFRSVLRKYARNKQVALAVSAKPPFQASARQQKPFTQAAFNPQFIDWGEAIEPSIFLNRTAELSTLKHWIVQDRCRLVALLGIGGIGKTTLAAKLTEEIQRSFEYLIWRSLRNAPSVFELLAELIQFLSQGTEIHLPTTLNGIVLRLKYYLRTSRCLLILDHFESVLQSGALRGAYREGYEGYGQLLKAVGAGRHQSCLLLTSREKPKGLVSKEGKNLPVRSLYLSGLPEVEAGEILAEKGLCVSDEESRILSYHYGGNPLVLKIAATVIQELFDGDVVEFLRQGTLIFGGICELLNEQFKRLSDIEKQVMCWIVIHPEGVRLTQLQEEIVPPLSQSQLLEALQSLQQRSLIETTAAQFTQQPVVRKYMTQQRICEQASLITGTSVLCDSLTLDSRLVYSG